MDRGSWHRTWHQGWRRTWRRAWHRAWPLVAFLAVAACDSRSGVSKLDGGAGGNASGGDGGNLGPGTGGSGETGGASGSGTGGTSGSGTGGTSGSGTGGAVTATGGSGTGGNAGGAGGRGGGGGSGGRIAVSHRPVAMMCGSEPRSAGMCSIANTGATLECTADSQCTSGPNGRCVGYGRVFTCSCTYDACVSDGDCKLGGPCVCRSNLAGANTCLAGNCRVDADCGAGGSCSPTYDFGCGHYIGIVGYFCHTPRDSCLDDSDCAPPGECRHNPATGAWVCASSQCVG